MKTNPVITETIKYLKNLRNYSIFNVILCCIANLFIDQSNINQGIYTGMSLSFIDLSPNNIAKTLIFIVMLAFVSIIKTTTSKIKELENITE